VRPADTSGAAWEVQLAVWRRMGPAGRSRAAAALSESLFTTVRDQIAAEHPEWTPRQVTAAMILRVHGIEVLRR
jgi:hypothetical protein